MPNRDMRSGGAGVKAVATLVLGLGLSWAAGQPLRAQAQAPAALGDQLPVTAAAATGGGFALWNAGAGSAERAATGHATSWTTCSAVAPYYLATRDHVDAVSTAGLTGAGPLTGLPGFAAALAANGFTPADVRLGWTAQSLGDDLEGTDWTFDQPTGVETRHYTGGEITVTLRGEPLAAGYMPPTTMRVEHADLANCQDDVVGVTTDPVRLVDRSSAGSTATQAVASALLADLAGSGVRVAVSSLTSAGSLTGGGRTGTFLEAAAGAATVAAPCSCRFEAEAGDDTHEWTLRWDETTLPTGGGLRLKAVAVTTARSTSTAGTMTVTVFDDRDPERGVLLDLAFPEAPGEVEGLVDLAITPGTEYRFTVRAPGTGHAYRLGGSHASLRIAPAESRRLPGRSQDWALDAAAGEAIALTIGVPAATGTTSPTTAEVTVVDAATGDIVKTPARLSLAPGAVRTVSFTNTGIARRLVVQVEADGTFSLERTAGAALDLLACPTRTGPSTPILTITDQGVSPRVIDLRAGHRIFVVNESSSGHQLASDPHPIHTDCPPMNSPGGLNRGQSGLTEPFTEVRTCTWHDHLNPISQALRGEVRIGGIASSGGGSATDGDTGGDIPGLPDYLTSPGHDGHSGH